MDLPAGAACRNLNHSKIAVYNCPSRIMVHLVRLHAIAKQCRNGDNKRALNGEARGPIAAMV